MLGASKIEQRDLNTEQPTLSHGVWVILPNPYLFIYSAKRIGLPLAHQRGQMWVFHHSQLQPHVKCGNVGESSSLTHLPLFSSCASVTANRLTGLRKRYPGNEHCTRLRCFCVLPVTKAGLTVITRQVGDINHALDIVSQ